jgi:ABC-type polysaccharide/polyol phosphate transport system ATPase subunit
VIGGGRMENIIEVMNLSVQFRIIKRISIKEWARQILSSNRPRYNVIEALNGISFNIKKGSIVGIIGENGSGKSTLLRVIARIYSPDSGAVNIHTDSISLLSLAAGFNFDLSVLDNIYINGLLLGLSKKQIDEKLDNIIAFAELEDFITTPVRALSSGMKSKLAFSIASHVDPELLLIDEVFSVGDARFRKKSSEKIKELITSDRTVLMVSHSEHLIRELCTELIWLDKGKLVAQGNVNEILNEYRAFCKR